jgi:hypothetical protein
MELNQGARLHQILMRFRRHEEGFLLSEGDIRVGGVEAILSRGLLGERAAVMLNWVDLLKNLDGLTLLLEEVFVLDGEAFSPKLFVLLLLLVHLCLL